MNGLTLIEEISLRRFKRAYAASAHLCCDRRTGNHLAFLAWLVRDGAVDEDRERCAGCARRLRYRVADMLAALDGAASGPWHCARCGAANAGAGEMRHEDPLMETGRGTGRRRPPRHLRAVVRLLPGATHGVRMQIPPCGLSDAAWAAGAHVPHSRGHRGDDSSDGREGRMSALTHEGYHFLQSRNGSLFSASGDEPSWTVGETRTLARKKIALCQQGYHWSPTWRDALAYSPDSPVATRIVASEPVGTDDSDGQRKRVSHSRRLVAAATAGATERALRRFAAECARRALGRERAQGREPHAASWAAVEMAERLAAGEGIDSGSRESAAGSAWSAAAAAESAWSAAAAAESAWSAAAAAAAAAWSAAAAAWSAAAGSAAGSAWSAAAAAWSAAAGESAAGWSAAAAEREWQARRLAELLDSIVMAGVQP